MMIALLLVGFMMMTLGVALMFLGEVPFLGGKRISAWRSRLIGLVQMSFLPMALGIWKGLQALLGSDAVDGSVVTWSLFGFCWFMTIFLLYRVVFPKRMPRANKGDASSNVDRDPFPEQDTEGEPAADPFGFAEAEPEPVKQPSVKKKAPAPIEKPPAKPASKPKAKQAPAPPAEDDNPFNFS